MSKEPTVFLHHIFEAITDIEEYTKDLTKLQFMEYKHKVNQGAVVRRLEVIGEAVRYLPETFKQQHPEVAWSKALAMRNKLIHEYFGVDLDLVWDTVTDILPSFKEQITTFLNEQKKEE